MDEEPPCFIDSMMDEILLIILSKLTPYELCNSVPYVCKHWYNLVSDPYVWNEAELIFKRTQPVGNIKRFVNTLNLVPRLQRLDISASPSKFNPDTNLFPVAQIVMEGANLQRNLKLKYFAFSYNLPDILSILDHNSETITSLHVNDFYCQEVDSIDWDTMVQYRIAHESLVYSVLVKIKSLPALRKLSYDFGECWKYLVDDESREESVNHVMDCIRSMTRLEELDLMNLVWRPPHPVVFEQSSLRRLSVYESCVGDAALAALVKQNRMTLMKIELPDSKVEDHTSQALKQCPHLQHVYLRTFKAALPLAASAPKLSSLQISTVDKSNPLDASEIFKSSLFQQLSHLSLYNGGFEDSVLTAILQSCKNLKTLELQEILFYIPPILGGVEEEYYFKRLGSRNNPVVLLELSKGACPKLENLDIDLRIDWKNNLKDIQTDWIEPLKNLSNARPHLLIG